MIAVWICANEKLVWENGVLFTGAWVGRSYLVVLRCAMWGCTRCSFPGMASPNPMQVAYEAPRLYALHIYDPHAVSSRLYSRLAEWVIYME
jgi:hypothetical protein